MAAFGNNLEASALGPDGNVYVTSSCRETTEPAAGLGTFATVTQACGLTFSP